MQGGKQSKVDLRIESKKEKQGENMQNSQQSNFEQVPQSIGGEYRESTEKQKAQHCCWRRCGGGDLAEYKLTMQGQEGHGSI